ncbi:hypothetical protein ACT8ZV_05535 [Nocardioides sp. MAHUQ-72]|uniref:hypothetical protein n=1 Tax=unclassified Nocardioides TaxID=2615069 RepID=UPI00360BD09A
MSDTFRFGNVSGPVNAGSGNMNVGSGSQQVAGRDVAVGSRIGADPDMAAEIEALRAAVAELRLTAGEREAAEVELGALAEAGDKQEAAGHLESFVKGLDRAGALATAGSSFLESLTRLATWIGPLAAGALALL